MASPKEDSTTAKAAGDPDAGRKPEEAQSSPQDNKQQDVANEPEEGQLPDDNDTPPLPDEEPPLPEEAPPQAEDDGWQAMWDPAHQAYYFFNRFTQVSQWENPRVPDASSSSAPAAAPPVDRSTIAGGYDPKIHGKWDPNADYAKRRDEQEGWTQDPTQADTQQQPLDPNDPNGYASTATFNRFTGRFQNTAFHDPSRHSDEAKSRRQMNAYFDVDAAANSNEGKSLKEERQQQKLSKERVQYYRERAKKKKEEKRRAWLRD